MNFCKRRLFIFIFTMFPSKYSQKRIKNHSWYILFTKNYIPALLLFNHYVMSDPLRPHGLQHARLLCPSLYPGVCSDSSPLSQWCYIIISSSAAHLLLPSIFPSIWFFSNESGLCIRWPNSSISLHKTLSIWQPRIKMERGQTIQGFSKCVPSVLTAFQGAHKVLFTFVNFIVPYVCVVIFPKGYVTCGIPVISFDWMKMDMRIQLSALWPDMTEICENVKHCYSSPLLFLFWKIQLFFIKYITYTDEMVYYCLKWINKCWKIFSTLIFNTGNIGRYNLPCIKLFEVTDHFPVTEHRFFWDQKVWEGLNYTNRWVHYCQLGNIFPLKKKKQNIFQNNVSKRCVQWLRVFHVEASWLAISRLHLG